MLPHRTALTWRCGSWNIDTRLRAGNLDLCLRTQEAIISWRFLAARFFERLFSICISWHSLHTLINRSWFCSVIQSFICLVLRRFVPLRILSLSNYFAKIQRSSRRPPSHILWFFCKMRKTFYSFSVGINTLMFSWLRINFVLVRWRAPKPGP